MVRTILEEGVPPKPVWLDITNPTREELESVAQTHNLHPTLVQDCVEPGHLPKYEKQGETTFIIIRSYDSDSSPLDDQLLTMTNKLALFLGDRFLLCFHRKTQPFLEALHQKYACAQDRAYLQIALLEILMAAVETYHRPLEEMETLIQRFETAILRNEDTAASWEEIFRTKCRLMIIKRMLWHSLNTVQKFIPYSSANLPACQDLKERIESLQFFADGLLDDLTSLLNVQISLASNRTNDVMKVLTIFSVFFLPINFIVGVYGMNFEHIPELKWKYGYFVVWGVILATVVTIFIWFRKRRWL